MRMGKKPSRRRRSHSLSQLLLLGPWNRSRRLEGRLETAHNTKVCTAECVSSRATRHLQSEDTALVCRGGKPRFEH